MSIFLATLKALKFSVKLLTGLLRRKKPKRPEREQNQLKHIRNFDPTRLKNRSWQKSIGKDMKKRSKKRKKKVKK